MNKKKKKEKKKKDRERRVKKEVLTRRDKKRQESKYEKELDREVRANRSLSEKPEPFVKPVFTVREDAEIMSQLEHNLERLKALEEQYIAEEKKRVELNDQLEEEGYSTLEEKMKALGEKAEAIAEEQGTEGIIDWTN